MQACHYLRDVHPGFQELFGVTKSNHGSNEYSDLPDRQTHRNMFFFECFSEYGGRKSEQRDCAKTCDDLTDQDNGKMIPAILYTRKILIATLEEDIFSTAHSITIGSLY